MSISAPASDEMYAPAAKPLWAYVWPWLLLIPMLVYAAGTQFSFQAGSQNESTSGGLGVGAIAAGNAKGQRELLFLSYSILMVLICSRYRRVLQLALQMKGVSALALLTVASAIWSQQPTVTLPRSLYYLVDTLFVYWISTKLTSAQIRSYIMMVGSVICLCSLFMVAVLPRYGVVGTVAHFGAWQGIFAEKNHAGGVYLFLLTPVVDFSRRPSRKRILYAFFVLLLLFMSESRTAWVGAVLYPSAMFFLHMIKRIESRFAMILSVVLFGSILALAVVIVPNLTDILSLLGRDPTLTGRTIVWGLLIKAIAKKPLLGYGFNGFWTGMTGESGAIWLMLGWAFSYAHDGYLEVMLQVGILGLSVILCLLVFALRDAWFCFQRSRDAQVEWFTGIILLTIVYNFDEETFMFAHHLPSFLLLLAVCGLRLTRQEITLRQPAHKAALHIEEAQPAFSH